jgi:hypothetical protein
VVSLKLVTQVPINSHILVGLKQGAYISQRLANGQTREDLVFSLGVNEQLVDMWISFLKNEQWIEWREGKWLLTAKGKIWTDKLLLFTTLPNYDESALLHDSAKQAFGLIKNALSESGIHPSLWSMLRFLLDHAKEPPNFSVQLENGNFILVITYDSESVHTLVFAKELLSIIFQEMSGVEVDVSLLPENTIKLRPRTQVQKIKSDAGTSAYTPSAVQN